MTIAATLAVALHKHGAGPQPGQQLLGTIDYLCFRTIDSEYAKQALANACEWPLVDCHETAGCPRVAPIAHRAALALLGLVSVWVADQDSHMSPSTLATHREVRRIRRASWSNLRR